MNEEVTIYENHAQDSRVKQIEVSDTRSRKDGTGGNNLPLVVFTQNQREEVRDLGDASGTLPAEDGSHQRTLVAAPATFGKTGHAVNAEGEGEKYAPVDVAQTLNTFQNQSDARAVELVVAPSVCKTLSAEGFDGMPDIQKGNGMPVVAIDMDKCKPSRADKDREGGTGLGVSEDDVAYTLQAREGPSKQNAIAVRTAQTGANGCGISAEAAHTLDLASGQAVAIGFKPGQSGRKDTGSLGARMEEAPTLPRDPGGMGVGVAVGFSHSNSDISIESKPLAECAMTIRSAAAGEGSVICPALCLDAYNQSATEESCMTLRSAMTGTDGNDADPKVCIGVKYLASEKSREPTSVNVSQALGAGRNDQAVAIAPDQEPALNHIVRRLTPVECERLMGFPDGWTKIPWRIWQESHRKGMSYERLLNDNGMKIREPTTEECPDSPRYKALGNSMATNCMEWVLRRVVAAEALGMIPFQEDEP